MFKIKLASILVLILIAVAQAASVVSAAYSLIQDEGVNLTRFQILNFTGAGVTCTNGTGKTVCNIPGGGAGSGAANYPQSFSAVTSVSLTHNLNTTAVIVQCKDNATPAKAIIPQDIAYTDANTTTVTFSAAQSGTCVVNGYGGSGQSVTNKTTSFTFDATLAIVTCDATGGVVTGTLPTAASVSAGRQYSFKKIDATANSCTYARSGADLIDGATSKTNTTQYQSFTVVSDGVSNWWTI